jgi:hypothetical protein
VCSCGRWPNSLGVHVWTRNDHGTVDQRHTVCALIQEKLSKEEGGGGGGAATFTDTLKWRSSKTLKVSHCWHAAVCGYTYARARFAWAQSCSYYRSLERSGNEVLCPTRARCCAHCGPLGLRLPVCALPAAHRWCQCSAACAHHICRASGSL